MIKEEVDSEDIAEIVSRWTGIPVKKIPSEKEKLLHPEEELHKRVIGQDDAIRPSATPCAARVPGSTTRAAPSAHLSSWELPESERPNSRRPR